MREQRIDNNAVHTGSLILVDAGHPFRQPAAEQRSEEHTSELQSPS